MKRTKKEKQKDADLNSYEDNPYPWGLTVSLDNDSAGKLDVGTFEVGDELIMVSRVTVKSVNVSSSQHDGGKVHRNMELQITDMSLEEEEGKTSEEKAKTLYPTS